MNWKDLSQVETIDLESPSSSKPVPSPQSQSSTPFIYSWFQMYLILEANDIATPSEESLSITNISWLCQSSIKGESSRRY